MQKNKQFVFIFLSFILFACNANAESGGLRGGSFIGEADHGAASSCSCKCQYKDEDGNILSDITFADMVKASYLNEAKISVPIGDEAYCSILQINQCGDYCKVEAEEMTTSNDDDDVTSSSGETDIWGNEIDSDSSEGDSGTGPFGGSI